MNMASICIFSVFLVISISVRTVNAGFVDVECKAENMGQYGQESLLNCFVKTSQEVTNPKIRFVIWKKVEDEGNLLTFKQGAFFKKEGYRFADPSWNTTNMNISLLINNTAVKDEGDYKCTVVTNSGDSTTTTKLKVAAKYSLPSVQSITENLPPGVDGALICNCNGGYPEGQLLWFDEHNTDWTRSSQMEAKQEKNGLFHLSSKLTLLRGSTFSKYTCVVLSASGDKEHGATYSQKGKVISDPVNTTKAPQSASKIVAPVVVIGSLIVGLLLLLLLFRRRSQQARRPSTSPLMGDHQEVCTCDIEEGDHQEVRTCDIEEGDDQTADGNFKV